MAGRAQTLLDLGRSAEAVEVLQRALADEPESYRLLCLLALAQQRCGNHRESRDAAGRAVAIRPDSEWAHRLVSLANTSLRFPIQAVEAGQEAVRLAPESWQTHHTLALAYIESGEHEPALRHSGIARELAPEEADTHFIHGLAALRAGDKKTARAEFERNLALRPDHAAAHNNLAKLSIDRGGLLEGAQRLSSALASDPQMRVARRNVHILARRALRRFHWCVVLAYFVLGGLLSSNDGGTSYGTTTHHTQRPALTVAAVGALVALVVVAVAIDRRLPANLRGYFRRLPRTDSWIGGWLAVDVIALLLITAMALPLSDSARTACRGVAWLCLLLGVLISRRGAVHARREAAET